jgi:hypothetical protein
MVLIETKLSHIELEKRPAPTFLVTFLPIDPMYLQGQDQEGIDRLVPLFAQKGTAVDGGPKWTWVDAWGFQWEIRYHPAPNASFPARPSGCGSTIRFGMQVVSNPCRDEEIQLTDQVLIEKFGFPSQPAPVSAAQYVDKYGFVYFDVYGEITGLYSDEGHIKGTGNFWQPAFAMSLTEILKMPTLETTIYQEFLDLLYRYDVPSVVRLVESVLVGLGKQSVERRRSDDLRWAGEAFWTAISQLPAGELPNRLAEGQSSLTNDEISLLAASWADRLAVSSSLDDSVNVVASAVRVWMDTCDFRRFRQNRESDRQIIEKILWFWWCSLA